MLRITHHRRYTTNHTWHVDLARHHLFVKANPHHGQALAEYHGHARLRGLYPVPGMRGMWRAAQLAGLAPGPSPHPGQALAEYHGHARLRGLYPGPGMRGMWRAAQWTVLAYDRWPHLGTDSGLL